MKNLSTDDIVSRLVSTTDSTERQMLYQQWAETYDNDLRDFGYVAPALAVTQFCKTVADKSVSIYDAGCGTGLVGRLLNEQGFTNIEGADVSPEMLAKAKDTGNYRKLSLADYTKRLPIDDDTFDAIISIGVYTAKFENIFISEMLRILKPTGALYFTCRPQYFESSVAAELQQLLTEQIVESVSVQRKPYMLKQNADAFYVLVEPRLP